MYLSARRYIGNWPHSSPAETASHLEILRAAQLSPSTLASTSPHLHVEICVVYWRKANAIHKWFVENCQEGSDNCQPHMVSRADLTKLQKTCSDVLQLRHAPSCWASAQKLLPAAAGFFFGPSDDQEFYWESLEFTATQLRRVLTLRDLENAEFCYRSSW